MEKPEFKFKSKEAIPPDLRRFYSVNPRIVLGLGPDASIEDAKKAKRNLQKAFHPDRNENSYAPEIFRSIDTAFNAFCEALAKRKGQTTHTGKKAEPTVETGETLYDSHGKIYELPKDEPEKGIQG